MQKVHVLLHPTEIETHPEEWESRLRGKVEGNVLSDSSISTWASELWRARSNRVGRTSML